MPRSSCRRTAGFRRLVGCLFLTAAIFACSADQAGEERSADVSDVDLCGLLSGSRIAEVVGQEPGAPEALRTETGSPSCVWPAADGSVARLVHLRISPRSAETYEEYLQQARQATGGHFLAHDFEKVEGVGDFAVWAGSEKFGVLQAFSGGHMIQVSAAPGGGGTARENSIELARAVIAETS